jgi:gentisate 1,2-dioxygenase
VIGILLRTSTKGMACLARYTIRGATSGIYHLPEEERMTLTRSNIVASPEDMQQFSAALQRLSVSALWSGQPAQAEASRGAPLEPSPQAVGHVWHWKDLRPQALRAGELVGTQQAERRVLQLRNPAINERSATTNTLFGGIQVVMPGEVARAHRHTMAALRFIIESEGGYTNVNGDPIPMLPGDLVLTPNWAWHDHANDSDKPMIWLDGLDAPLVRMLEAAFQEYFPQETQPLSPTTGLSPMHYPWSETREALDQLAADGQDTPFDGVILEYTNRSTGGAIMPTIGCFAQRLAPGQRTLAHKHTSSAIYHVVAGRGSTLVGGRSLDWEDKDTFCVPGWTSHQHVNTSDSEPAYLFSFTDIPVLKALELLREEPVPGEWG